MIALGITIANEVFQMAIVNCQNGQIIDNEDMFPNPSRTLTDAIRQFYGRQDHRLDISHVFYETSRGDERTFQAVKALGNAMLSQVPILRWQVDYAVEKDIEKTDNRAAIVAFTGARMMHEWSGTNDVSSLDSSAA